MHHSLRWMEAELQALESTDLRRRRRVVRSRAGGWCEIDGRLLRNFAGNDYLNLRHDPRVIAAAQAAQDAAGTGSGASPLVTGRTPWQAALESRLAEFEGEPAALLFPSGYAANLGLLSVLAGPEDLVFCDRLNHASLVDGCRLSGARLRVYRHDDLPRLRQELEKGGGARRTWIVTDAVFSMDGVCAPLADLCTLAERFGAGVIVDEAHGTGVYGPHGRGVAEAQQVEERIAVRIGTLSKAVGALGGFVAGSPLMIDWLWNRARTQIYSTALPPGTCAAATAALEIIAREPERRTALLELSAQLRSALQQAELELPPCGTGPILPIILHDPARATAVASRLEQLGFLVAAIRPPTVPQGTSRLRISLSAAHTPTDVQQLAAALIEEMHRFPAERSSL